MSSLLVQTFPFSALLIGFISILALEKVVVVLTKLDTLVFLYQTNY